MRKQDHKREPISSQDGQKPKPASTEVSDQQLEEAAGGKPQMQDIPVVKAADSSSPLKP